MKLLSLEKLTKHHYETALFGVFTVVFRTVADAAKENNLPIEYFENHFDELYTAAYETFSKQLETAYNSQEFKNIVRDSLLSYLEKNIV